MEVLQYNLESQSPCVNRINVSTHPNLLSICHTYTYTHSALLDEVKRLLETKRVYWVWQRRNSILLACFSGDVLMRHLDRQVDVKLADSLKGRP